MANGTKVIRRQAGSREGMDVGTRPYRLHCRNGSRRMPMSPLIGDAARLAERSREIPAVASPPQSMAELYAHDLA